MPRPRGRMAVTPVRTLRPSARSSISVTCPTVTPATSVIAFSGPGVPSKGTPRSRARGSPAAAAVGTRGRLSRTGRTRFMSGLPRRAGRRVPRRDFTGLRAAGARDRSNERGHMQERKELGFWMCTALVIGNTIGIGIFVLPASLAPYGFNAMIGWGITVLGMTVLARVFARLAREFPDGRRPLRLHRGDDRPRAGVLLDLVLLGVLLDHQCRDRHRRGRLPRQGRARPRRGPAGRTGTGAAVAVRAREPARRAHGRPCAGGHHGAQAAADGRDHPARRLAARDRARRLRAPSAHHAAHARRR